ncbi:MAG: hypothetical protein GC189_11910 [Alphaproteobacteria bacterium]|nr:hypothetical protein [Alphaproteobacteria bacterium]
MMKRPFTVAEQSQHFLTRRHDAVPQGRVEGRAAWMARDLPRGPALKQPMSDALVEAWERRLGAAGESAREDAYEPVIAEAVETWRRELLDGRGFVLLRGAPVRAWSLNRAKAFMQMLGACFGRLGMQSSRTDHLIAEVRNTGAALRDPFSRNYITDREFRFHCDAADLLGLLCVRKARDGGLNKLASSVTVYNELQRRRPDLAKRLFAPVYLDLRNEQVPGSAAFAEVVPCAYAEGALRTFYISDYFRSVDRHGEIKLPADYFELFDLYEEIADHEDISVRVDLDPGDILLINNHVMLHARTAFEDEPGAERLLLRFLVSVGA